MNGRALVRWGWQSLLVLLAITCVLLLVLLIRPTSPRADRPGLAHARAQSATPLAKPYSQPIGLRLSRSRVGVIAARVTGAAGTRVVLRVRPGGPARRSVVIPRSGSVSVPRLITWSCARRTRSVTAASAAGEFAHATIATPSCAHRLRVNIPASATVGGSLTVTTTDRWRLGGIRARLCITPPGGIRQCVRAGLEHGERARSFPVAIPRPGRWAVSVRAPFRHSVTRHVWAEHPGGQIELFAGGDSEMQILDTEIAQDLGGHGVSVSSDARESTGLTNSFFFNWQNEARLKAATVRPDVSVIFLGANDGFSVAGPNGQPVACCGPDWSAGYANLVAEMTTSLLRGNAGRVYWYILPAPRPATFARSFAGVNAGIRLAAQRFPGRVGLIDTNAFFTPGNVYRDSMTVDGHGFAIHEADGVHLSSTSDVYAAELFVQRLIADHIIR